ncbi:CopY family transcriptional regulator [Paenibacillus donghaensis]|uniref:CopY family transcriptional regulator n=2 Tax=Paenibacillus donghaensis TaxID=414771 RepID=A0A2Z2KIC2_9BACL|nr:CopY family transcriptional regulator [Paenibacillus donghaensis]
MRLPDAELEIMKIIWDTEIAVTSADIMEQLQGKKTWGVTTVLNFLTRLLERGFVTSERKGRFNFYTASVDEKTYLEQESQSILQKLYGNSIKSFVASLYDSQSLTKDDLDELRNFIDQQTKEE